MVTTPSPETTTRRGLLDWIIGICSAIFGAAMAFPALAYLSPVVKSGPVKVREEVGDAGTWKSWEARKVSVGGKPVLVIRTDKEFIALSAVCTHLGCLVEFHPATRKIICPCHAAGFDLDGQVVSGPPPRALPAFTVSEAQGSIYVSS